MMIETPLTKACEYIVDELWEEHLGETRCPPQPLQYTKECSTQLATCKGNREDYVRCWCRYFEGRTD